MDTSQDTTSQATSAASPSYFLAADGGGTKTQVWCADASGKVVGEGNSGPTNLTATSVGAASFNLREGIRQAVAGLPPQPHFECLCIGLAGLDVASEEATAHQVFQQAVAEYQIGELLLVNDAVIGLESQAERPDAVVLIAGTGSACWGRNAAGQTAKAGGLDYLLSDQGSGYWLGHQVLRAAVASYDGTGPTSLLQQLVCDKFHVPNAAELKTAVYNPALSKSEVAECALLCSDALDQNDEVAQQLFNQVTQDLCTMLQSVISRLGLDSTPTDVVLVGSITQLPVVHQPLVAWISEHFPQVSFPHQDHPPVFGALKLAMSATDRTNIDFFPK